MVREQVHDGVFSLYDCIEYCKSTANYEIYKLIGSWLMQTQNLWSCMYMCRAVGMYIYMHIRHGTFPLRKTPIVQAKSLSTITLHHQFVTFIHGFLSRALNPYPLEEQSMKASFEIGFLALLSFQFLLHNAKRNVKQIHFFLHVAGLQASCHTGARVSTCIHHMLAVMMLCLIQQSLDSWLREAPCARV